MDRCTMAVVFDELNSLISLIKESESLSVREKILTAGTLVALRDTLHDLEDSAMAKMAEDYKEDSPYEH